MNSDVLAQRRSSAGIVLAGDEAVCHGAVRLQVAERPVEHHARSEIVGEAQGPLRADVVALNLRSAGLQGLPTLQLEACE